MCKEQRQTDARARKDNNSFQVELSHQMAAVQCSPGIYSVDFHVYM